MAACFVLVNNNRIRVLISLSACVTFLPSPFVRASAGYIQSQSQAMVTMKIEEEYNVKKKKC